jgi:MoxR-like ATPase
MISEYLYEISRNPAALDQKPLPGSWQAEDLEKAEGYKPDEGLVAAMDVSRLLGQPLLITGEPGTGKTQFAYYVSWALRLAPPLLFETKSTSTSRDLFYSYDALGRFHDAQIGRASLLPNQQLIDQTDYLTYNAFGLAILRASKKEAVAKWLPKNFEHGEPQISVVLIDEIDKAPRDFPNDILNEVENMYFKIPEVRDPETNEVVRISAEPTMRPLLILTSNSEQHLPDAFLRRCVYYNIPFPTGQRLLEIIESRVGIKIDETPGGRDALEIFYKLREPNSGLKKRPATAELLNWLTVLREKKVSFDRPLRLSDDLTFTLSTLIKTASDQKTAQTILDGWLAKETA